MQRFLKWLTRSQQTGWTRYVIVFAAIGLLTAFRLVVPLDATPFLLYFPTVFLLSVALGRGPGLFGVALSTLFAALLFDHPGDVWWRMSEPQWAALAEYSVVASGMVAVCVALRHMFAENEAAVANLRASEGSMHAILDTVPVGILFAEAPSGRVVRRNRQLDEIVGASAGVKTLAEYGRWTSFHADGRTVEANEYPLSQVIRGMAEEAALAVRYQRRDGSQVWVDLKAKAMRDASGTLAGAVVAVTDIDARKSAEAAQEAMTGELRRRKEEAEAAQEAAESANRAKSAFLANMSHELRTPLSAVIGYTELLEEETGDAAMLTDLGKIRSNAKHLLSLINDVLDLSKVEANKMEILVETFEVESFLADVVATIGTLVKVKANTLVLDMEPDLGTTRTDAVKLRQCLFNLLGNACKFTENGRIVLRVRRVRADGRDRLTFAIEDTGIGMTPEQVQRLFQRFTQADESTTRKFGGTGLGLALTRAFSTLLGGDVDVTSREGEGTCFTLSIPAEATAVETEDRGSDPDPAQASARDLVLVVDDEASQRELLTRFLHKQAFSVRTASDGRAGLELARTLQPRVILLDVMMPDLDGWSVLKELKADEATGDIPVVIVSFVAEPKLGAALGAADSVTKPVNWAKLKLLLEGFRQVVGDVLVVDDDADTRARLRKTLEKSGWSVREAEDGAEALERARETLPQLVLLDLTMPVMDGFAFLDALRALPGGPGVSVVVLSARDITQDERARLIGTDRIFSKAGTSLRDLAAELRVLQAAGAPSAPP